MERFARPSSDPGLSSLAARVRTAAKRLASRRPRLRGELVIVFALLAQEDLCEPGLREDVLECEEAAAHLEHCCGSVPDDLDCEYSESCGSVTLPTFDPSTSRAVESMSCQEIVARDYCTRPPLAPRRSLGDGALSELDAGTP